MSQAPATVHDIATPAAVLELSKLKANTKRMADRAHGLSVKLRPHVKTHKCVEAARYQVDGHFGGITVSTLAEADAFAKKGFKDITYAVPLGPGRTRRAVSIHRRIPTFQVIVDNSEVVAAVETCIQSDDPPLRCLLKVDCGYHRAGLKPDDPELVRLAHQIRQSPALKLVGVLAHGGHAYDCIGVEAIQRVAEEERAETVRAANRLRAAGIDIDVVSVGSTPTASVAHDLTGVTEIRPGNYALYDVFQSEIGSCQLTDIAFSILTEVIGVYRDRDTLLVDAGALALSKDPGAIHIDKDPTFGIVCQLNGAPVTGLSLVGLSQEHGKIRIDKQFEGTLPLVGSRLRILPNHSCLAAALHREIKVLDGDSVVDTWRPVSGW